MEYGFKDAVEVWDLHLKARLPDIKKGSEPFMMVQEKGQAPTVVLLHGHSDSAGSMREIAQSYYDRGFNVVAPLLNDHGLIGPLQKVALSNSSLDEWRKDVDFALAVAKGLSSEDGKIHIGGYSMGASLAMDLSWRHPGLVLSRTLYAPLFREQGMVIQSGVKLFKKFGTGFFYKSIDETPISYKIMSYKQTEEMYRLLRQIQPYILKRYDEIPTAVFRVEAKDEKTVDNRFIDSFVKEYGITHRHYTHYNRDPEGKPLAHPVLHRDLTNKYINSNGQLNSAIEMIDNGIGKFLADLSYE